MTIHAMKGSKGSVVEKIQRRLNLIVPGAALTPDGDFGNLSEAAVVAFQKQSALEPDGVVGDFTNAALFGEDFAKTHRNPAEVPQSNGTMCWAAATASWLTTRPERRNYTQEQIRDGMIQEGGARADGGLLIPNGQRLWEQMYGLRPIGAGVRDFYAESAFRRMASSGPLLVGYKSAGTMGHVEVMWGTEVSAGRPCIVTMDPMRDGGHYKRIPVKELHDMGGRITTWLPGLPLML